jgi:hypothetical protein
MCADIFLYVYWSIMCHERHAPFAYTTIGLCSMAMSTEVQAQVSKKDTIVLGGNMALRRGLGGGSVTLVLRRQLSPVSSVEVLAMVGFRSILSFQTSRQLSAHATGTLGVTWSLRDGSITLANTWSRQLSENTTGNVSTSSVYLHPVCLSFSHILEIPIIDDMHNLSSISSKDDVHNISHSGRSWI